MEYEDGVEMADRAVKIRIIIGHGKKKMRYWRPFSEQLIVSTETGHSASTEVAIEQTLNVAMDPNTSSQSMGPSSKLGLEAMEYTPIAAMMNGEGSSTTMPIPENDAEGVVF